MCLVTVPQHGTNITINGHQAKILVTDFQFGSKYLLYSTAEVLTYAVIDGKEVLALWVPTGESGEFTVLGPKSAKVTSCEGCANVKFFPGKSNITVSFTQNAGMSVVELSDGSRVVLLDRSAAYLFWAPSLTSDPVYDPDSTGKSSQISYFIYTILLANGIHSLRSGPLSSPVFKHSKTHPRAHRRCC